MELGPGTGFYRNYYQKRSKRGNLILIEIEKDFTELLKQKFPKAKILALDAQELKNYNNIPKIHTVICGLGFLNMSKDMIKKILESTFLHLNKDGDFFFFTYGHACSISQDILDELGLSVFRIGKTYRNIPPATVYKITKTCNLT